MNRNRTNEDPASQPGALESAPVDAPDGQAPAADPENTVAEHVPLSSGKGGCYEIGEDGKRVRVTG